MSWQPHFKIRVSSGIETFEYCFMKAEPTKEELINEYRKLLGKLTIKKNIVVLTGY